MAECDWVGDQSRVQLPPATLALEDAFHGYINRVFMSCSNVYKIFVSPPGIELTVFVTDHNVHILPRRFFASPQVEQAFRSELDRRIKPRVGSAPVIPL
jgi:hypothetical protein